MFVVQDIETETSGLPGGLLVKPKPRMVCLKFRHGDDNELSVCFDHASVQDGHNGILTYELTLANVMHYPPGDIHGRDLGCPDDQKFAEILGQFVAEGVIQ